MDEDARNWAGELAEAVAVFSASGFERSSSASLSEYLLTLVTLELLPKATARSAGELHNQVRFGTQAPELEQARQVLAELQAAGDRLQALAPPQLDLLHARWAAEFETLTDPTPQPIVTPPPTSWSPPREGAKKKTPFLLGIFAVLAIVLGALWWFLQTEPAPAPTGNWWTQVGPQKLPQDPRAEAYLFAACELENRLLRYQVGPSYGKHDSTLHAKSFDGPYGLTAGPRGLYISSVGLRGKGSLTYLSSPRAPTPTFSLRSSNGIQGPHGLTLSPQADTLWVAQERGSELLRIDLRNSLVTPFPLPRLRGGPRGLAFAPQGQGLFLSVCSHNRIVHLVPGKTGLSLRGSFGEDSLSSPHGLCFSPWGELFVANFGDGSVSRFSRDSQGRYQSGGKLLAPGAITVAFSPWGELFVATRSPHSGILRFRFDADQGAIPNGSLPAPPSVSELAFLRLRTQSEER